MNFFWPQAQLGLQPYLRTFISEIYLVPEMSFYAKSKSFNMSVASGNISMDQRRLSECFYMFTLLSMLNFHCRSVGRSVGWSVGRLVGRSAGRSVGW